MEVGDSGEPARLLRELPTHGAATVVAFAPDGRYVATASHSASAKLWDVTSGSLERTFISHDREIRSLAFSRDGVLLLTASDDRTGEARWCGALGRAAATLLPRERAP